MVRRQSSRVVFAAAALCAFGFLSVAAEAAPVTYALTLTATSGPESGTGTFTIATPAPSTGSANYTAGTTGSLALSAISFTIDGMLFNQANETYAPMVDFSNGSITTINFGAQLASYSLQLSTGGLTYSFSDSVAQA